MNFLRTSVLILALASSLVGCGSTPDSNSPPEIYYGEDVCLECGMIITEPKYAAAYYTPDGKAKIFDDLGELCSHYLEHEGEAAKIWAHDFESEEWIDAVEATFVVGDDIYTPMAFGIVAFQDLDDAINFSQIMDGDHMDFDGYLRYCKMIGGDHEMD